MLTSAPGALGAPSQSLAPPAVAQAPMILVDVPPDGYVHICMNQALSIWGHPDIVLTTQLANLVRASAMQFHFQ
jgi:hypothetical protein